MSSSKPRKALTLKEKIDVIRYRDANKDCSVRALAGKFKIGKTQVSEILKKRNELLHLYSQSSTNEKMCKLQRTGLSDIIDKTVLEWFNRVRSQNVPVSGPMLQEKAQDVGRELKLDNFKASNGWLYRFRTRHKIAFKAICGEAASVDNETVAEWKNKISSLIEGYDRNDIFNADETGLFYRALPDKTLCYKGETCSGRKIAKERLTVLLCASLEGAKLKPLVIGKALHPRCFKGVHMDLMGVDWRANKKAWMTGQLMTDWLEQLDRKMRMLNRKIILFLDNATSHVHLNLQNVKLVFFPPNVTSTCQPMDQGVIQNFKLKYRQLALQHLIANLDKNNGIQDLSKCIDVLKAATWIQKAWKDVSPSTIKNCFKKAGFPTAEQLSEENVEDDSHLAGLLAVYPKDVKGDFLTVDENLVTEGSTLNIKEILNEINPQQCSSLEVNELSDEEDGISPQEQLQGTKSFIKSILRFPKARLHIF